MAGGIQIRPAHFPGRAPIDAYGNGGFRFADMSHRGSLLCLPSGIHGWDVSEGDVLSIEHFDKVLEQADQIGVLLFGSGASMRLLPSSVRLALKEAGVALDVMNTGAAVRTYNIMLSEERPVAGAFLAVAG